MESNSQDRNLPASERKLQKAIDDGQVTRSRDLSHLAVLGVGSVALFALAPIMFARLQHSHGASNVASTRPRCATPAPCCTGCRTWRSGA
jgi:flagellar biosynthesis protein FlhB